AAEALFKDGKRLMKLGNFQEACPKLDESQRLDPGMGTLFNLAECNERIGKTATAWAQYLEVASQAKAAGQAAREKVARQRAAVPESKGPKLTILVRGTSPPPQLEVRREGEPVGRAQWSTAVPVDPGLHRVTASAPGKKDWDTTVRVPPMPGAVAIEVP